MTSATIRSDGSIQLCSPELFDRSRPKWFEPFVERAFQSVEVTGLEVDWARRRATLHTHPGANAKQAATQLATRLERSGGHAGGSGTLQRCLREVTRSTGEVFQIFRHRDRYTTWRVKHALPGRMRVGHPRLFRRRDLCQQIERTLMSAMGVSRYTTSPVTCSVLIEFDPRQITDVGVIDLLDTALAEAETTAKDKVEFEFALCTASVALATVAQFGVPALILPALGLFSFTVIPTFKSAWHLLTKERRLGVDLLDAVVATLCIATCQVFAGSVLAWCLCFGRKLLQRTRDDSKKLLLNVFGKQPRSVWLWKDGVAVETPLEQVRAKDIILVSTGETVPVDGRVTEGTALIDQHSLTGESAPVEKIPGSAVFASTVMVAGKLFVEVEHAGKETTAAQISRILENSAGFTLDFQNSGERLADRMVVPTLALSTVGYFVTGGLPGATAIANCDFGTGIRMAAPLALLSTLSACASRGILVKDGKALEILPKVDVIVFDKTGTLTRETPEIGRVVACAGHTDSEILAYAAAAEQRFSHPIAKAILERFRQAGKPLPETDASEYQVGFGIKVGVAGHSIRVGSRRFMENEKISIPSKIEQAISEAHGEGNSLVFVAVDDHLGGALEIQAALRPEIPAILDGLRRRGIEHLTIISGDHEAPTRKLAQRLGMDRYFAEVLPQDKGKYIDLLKAEGRTVCFIGDGINDSIALQKADVSISLRGASAIATDTAQVVFMEESLSKLCDLHDIAVNLQRNVATSWKLILVPNLLCIAGTFFLGFGVMASVLANNVAAIAALYNGLRPRGLIERN